MPNDQRSKELKALKVRLEVLMTEGAKIKPEDAWVRDKLTKVFTDEVKELIADFWIWGSNYGLLHKMVAEGGNEDECKKGCEEKYTACMREDHGSEDLNAVFQGMLCPLGRSTCKLACEPIF